MKHIFKLIIFTLGLAVVMHSCSRDGSSFDVNTINGIEIDTTGMSSLAVLQFDNLVVQPNLNLAGLSESQLSYEWKINLEPNDTLYQVLSDTKNLDSPITFKPTNPGYTHQLVYTVTDLSTDIDYMMSWPLTVLNNIGEGIVVAETTDGTTTDLSHIMSPEVTTDYSEVSVKHQVFSNINGTTIPGITRQIKYYQIYGESALLGITDETIYRIQTLDYTLVGTNGDLFFTPQPTYAPQALDQVAQGSLLINDGKLTSAYFASTRLFGGPFNIDYTIPGIVATNPLNNPAVVLNYYEETISKFVYQPSITQFGDRNNYEIAADVAAPFDPAAVTNKENLAAGTGTNGDFKHLLKDKSTGAIELYIFNGGVSAYPTPEPPKAIGYYDLTSAPGIGQATSFVFLNDQKVLYYATANKIYAVLYSTATPTVQERYTAPAGEEIGVLQIYQQADYPMRSSGSYLPLNNKALMMATYNGTEGKVYLLPFINTGIGNIDTPNIKTFTGFGRITALGTLL